MIDPSGQDLFATAIGSVFGAGGATWAVVRLQMKGLAEGVKEAKDSAHYAHKRMNDHLKSHADSH